MTALGMLRTCRPPISLLFLWALVLPFSPATGLAPKRGQVCRRDALLRGVGAVFLGGSAPALARDTPASAFFKFEGEYDDQLHPLCERKISVRVDNPGTKERKYWATISGNDVGPVGIGDKVYLPCSEKAKSQYPLRTFQFEASIAPDGQSVDAGDGVHVGKLNSVKAGDDFDGIRWQDGNRWIRLPLEDTTAAVPAAGAATTTAPP
jgi:hypothetical protein